MKDLLSVLRDWEAVIGLEVHTELTTLNSKMFCSCPVEFGAAPNTHVCPVCLGLPGALPVPNRAAIESIVLAGLATNCDIEKRTMFYRKNYFYPDMSRNLQVTQGPVAFCMRGHLDVEVSGIAAKERQFHEGTTLLDEKTGAYIAHINITRIHMEEDAGKLVHVGGTDGRISGASYSLVDYNRIGTPLIELVTEPDLRTPEEARLFLQKLRQTYLTLGISDCSMEEGSLRCDGNVSLRPRGAREFGTKTELKNMNSFKNLHDGLAYEICRQAEVLESGGTVRQETRHWEPAEKRTFSMRVKETADDYRYFPDPDLAPFDLSDEFIERVRARLPELPDAKKRRFVEMFGLAPEVAGSLAGDVEMAAFFDAAMDSVAWAVAAADKEIVAMTGATVDTFAALAKSVANLLLNEVAAYLNASDVSLSEVRFEPSDIAELAQLLLQEVISSKQAKQVLSLMAESGEPPLSIIERHGMKQVSDTGAIEVVVDEVLAANPDKVAEYQGGKTGLFGFFVGQVMQATKGQGNPKLINELLNKRLDN